MEHARDGTGSLVAQTGVVGDLSAELSGPVGLELAKPVEQLPGEQGQPGGSHFELNRLRPDRLSQPEVSAQPAVSC